ncbi:hypothetical protein [Gloeothece verrucosa]|uniref:Uncharacterized protein n=1 Tax=Gloeothece verrucosa (strain PCC 7822) TaxID=497965 RepID=E0UMJ9_GLOV7|nr:hypothetical protein [Gloeothece verrucosa]ADN18179.1 hypothetical protein Cyan7822_6394 [Gloeothece verrucosa PCC 7822]
MKVTPVGNTYVDWLIELTASEKKWVEGALKKALKEFPNINHDGLENWKFRGELFDLELPLTMARILYCKEFIEQCGIIKTPTLSSYQLKHDCEKWASMYITNGSMCVAAIGLGAPMRPVVMGSTNGLIAISRAGLKKFKQKMASSIA